MSRLHPAFNIVKLTLALKDPVPGQCPCPPPLLEIVNGEEEWIIEAILDSSRVINRKLQYLVKWEVITVPHIVRPESSGLPANYDQKII